VGVRRRDAKRRCSGVVSRVSQVKAVNVEIAVVLGRSTLPMQQLLRTDTSLSKNERILLVCATGRRSLATAQTLHDRGYTEVVSLAGGLAGLLAPTA